MKNKKKKPKEKIKAETERCATRLTWLKQLGNRKKKKSLKATVHTSLYAKTPHIQHPTEAMSHSGMTGGVGVRRSVRLKGSSATIN